MATIWQGVPVISDRELWACANEVLRIYGDFAHEHAVERLADLVMANDYAGATTWQAIAERIEQLQSIQRPDDQALQ